MKKYKVIVKADSQRFLKYRNVTNITKLVKYLDTNFPAWRWFNIFDHYGNQLSSYVRNKGYINARPSIKK